MVIDATSYSEEKQVFTYKSSVTIHVEAHKVLLYYVEAIVENQKVSKVLYGIKLGPMYADKATFIDDLWVYNRFTLTNDYLDHFTHS